ncbi:ATP-dependent DNA/RNA helicase, partial [Xylographa trunciseda]|nr:ATP-dependent DNA/RNA helicase [Xylographa trunciseda]
FDPGTDLSMKRKLNDEDVPIPVTPERPNGIHRSFESLGLDARLLQAIQHEKFVNPTPVQSQAIPLALEGKDILGRYTICCMALSQSLTEQARAKTGSGKTAAYVLPILEAILRRKATAQTIKATTALVLVPTRELAEQVTKAFTSLSAFCAKDISTINLTQKTPDTVQRSLLADLPDIVVATPARAFLNISTSALSLQDLAHLVIDEADLVLSYGYEENLQNVAKATPNGVQTYLMSATLSTEVDTLKGLFCRDPVVLALDDAEDENNGVSQYVVKCAEDEKFLLVYVIFKLKLVKGKCIIFVGDIDRCYRLKLYLEQFGIRSCVLNSELPVNSRIHVVEEFNKGVYDIIIASDEHEVLGSETRHAKRTTKETSNGISSTTFPSKTEADVMDDTTQDPDEAEQQDALTETSTLQTTPKKKWRKPTKTDKEYGISRGIDFKNVACVLNFDLPTTAKSYTHRIGRTARAGKTGMALSFVVPASLYRKHKPTTFPTAQHDEEVLAKITAQQVKKSKEVKPYHFDMQQVAAFRYRMSDALRAVTRVAIREARTRELRQELLKSEKLKRHFEENPEDLHHLRHDGELRAARVQAHLKHVPDYLMPSNGAKGIAGREIGFVSLRKESDNRIRNARLKNRGRGKGRKVGRRTDPLKTFTPRGKR